MGQFGNRASQKEGGSFKVGGLPFGLPNVFNSDSSVPLILLILRLEITTLLWEDVGFRESHGDKKHCTYKLGAHLVSSLTRKGLRGCHAPPYNKNKIEQTKHLQLFPDPTANLGHKANHCPPNWREGLPASRSRRL